LPFVFLSLFRPFAFSRSQSVSRSLAGGVEVTTNGVLNLDKPAGPTSHDVVARVRRLCGTKRVGHAGTLDPAATGVLVVLLGVATRLAEYATDLPKQYDAVIQFGLRTDSQDTTGAVLSREDTSSLTEADVEAALPAFRGEIMQTPPMVSAVKVEGKRLYELARRGETVERAARPVTIHSLRLVEFHPGPAAWGRLLVECSSGTYIRTLCADLGESLSCGASMDALRRTRIGPFRVDAALSLEALEQAVNEGRLSEALQPSAAAVAHLPAVTVGPEERRRLLHGMTVRPSSTHFVGTRAPLPSLGGGRRQPAPLPGTPLPGVGRGAGDEGRLGAEGRLVRVLDEAHELIAIGRWEPEAGQEAGHGIVAPVKVLAGEIPSGAA
jgi:tRNA pseudouridine55 synthase